jgi:two-component system, chemotaxis family, CheB/CheR fusion protein
LSSTAPLSPARHLAALVESSHDAIVSKTLDGTIQSWNHAAERIFGYSADEIIGKSVLLLIPPERHHEEEVILAKLRNKERIEHYETVRRRKDGSPIDVSISVSPILDEAGNVVGGSKIARDVTERRRADSIAYHFAAIVESSQDAIISKSLHGIIGSWNAAAERMFGYRADEIIGQSVLVLIPMDRRHEEAEIIARIQAGDRIEHFETVRRHKDGTLLDISLTISPVKNAQGEIIGASKIARDIRDKKRAEATRELLLNEIKHRVKNTLGTVQGIVAQTFKRSPQEDLRAFSLRLQALSNAHDLLTQKNWQGATLQEVAEQALIPFAVSNRITLSGPTVELIPSKALTIAMLLHELGTNASKYGALSNDAGVVRVMWDHVSNHATLVWQESGGPTVSPPTHVGFGTRMIERSLKAEGGSSQLVYEPSGLLCSITVALTV